MSDELLIFKYSKSLVKTYQLPTEKSLATHSYGDLGYKKKKKKRFFTLLCT